MRRLGLALVGLVGVGFIACGGIGPAGHGHGKGGAGGMKADSGGVAGEGGTVLDGSPDATRSTDGGDGQVDGAACNGFFCSEAACKDRSCRPLDCGDAGRVVSVLGQCCPQCMSANPIAFVQCLVEGKYYGNGATVSDPFSCNTCTCYNGFLVDCTKRDCPKACPEKTLAGIGFAGCGPFGGSTATEYGCFRTCSSSEQCDAPRSCIRNQCELYEPCF
jgi:hypothetical protein